MQLTLSIETNDRPFVHKIFNAPAIADAKPVEIGDGVAVQGTKWHLRKGGNFPELIEVVVTFGVAVSANVAAALLAHWLLGLKGKVEKLTLERTEIQFDSEEKIKKIIIEKMTKM